MLAQFFSASSPTFFGMRRRFAAASLALFLVAACGQEGTSSTTAGSGGGSGGGGSSGAGTAGASGTGGSTGPGVPFSVVNWNTRNFFDTVKDDPQNVDENVFLAAQYQTKLQTIGAVVKNLDPDIAVLCEIEHQAILDDLNKNELGGAYVATALVEGNDYRGLDIGVLSKVPIDQVVSHKDEFFTLAGTNGPAYKFSRDCLEIHVTYEGRHVILLGVHFRSKAGTDDPDKRLAEAQHVRQIANALSQKDPNAAIVILGDTNDLPDSPPVKALMGSDPDLYEDVAMLTPPAERYSFNFMGTLELIDHQMPNPLLYKMLEPTSVVLLHGKDIDDAGQYSSDHSPLKATYLVK